MLNLDEVLTFKAVANSGNFTAAAEKLHLTQSAVSHQIRRLEAHLGQKLFQRTTRSVRLTLAGERFQLYAEQLLALSKSAELSIANDGIKGEVRIGIPEEFAYSKLAVLLKRFRLHFPHIALSIEVGLGHALNEKLKNGTLDILLSKQLPVGPDCIRDEPLVWMGKASLLEQHPLPMGFYPGPCVFRKAAISALQAVDIDYSVVLISASLETLRIAAKDGSIIGVVPQGQCPPALQLAQDTTGLPKLPKFGYRLQYDPTQATASTKVAAELIEELLLQ